MNGKKPKKKKSKSKTEEILNTLSLNLIIIFKIIITNLLIIINFNK